MANCGCKGSTCSCRVVAGSNVKITGIGDANRPIRIDALPLSLSPQNSSTIDIFLTGSGSQEDPWVARAELSALALSGKWSKWSGTQAAYDALGSWDVNTLYMILES